MRPFPRGFALDFGIIALCLFLLFQSQNRSKQPAESQRRSSRTLLGKPLPATEQGSLAAPGVTEQSPGAAGAIEAGKPPTQAATSLPVIDSVSVEKAKVCIGEQNLVTVRAHLEGPAGRENSDDLRYLVAGIPGRSVPVRLYPATAGYLVRGQWVEVYTRDGVAVRAEIPAYEVDECRPKWDLSVVGKPVMDPQGESDVWEFRADLADYRTDQNGGAAASGDRQDGGARKKPKALRYVWNFGDGTRTESSEPTIRHGFGARPQSASYSQLLVSVEATTENREVVQGRLALQLENRQYVALRESGQVIVQVMARSAGEFTDGTLFAPVTYHHLASGKVTWTQATVTERTLSPITMKGAKAADASPEELEVDELLGENVTVRNGSVGTVVYHPRDSKLFAAVELRLEGLSEAGRPATATALLMRPNLSTAELRWQLDMGYRDRMARAMAKVGSFELTEQQVLTALKDDVETGVTGGESGPVPSSQVVAWTPPLAPAEFDGQPPIVSRETGTPKPSSSHVTP